MALLSEEDVVNSALIKLGSERISSLSEQTPPAIAANEIFDTIRDEVLRAHPWNFATKRTTLSPNSTTPDFEYDYTYDLPSDLLRVWDVYPDDIVYSIEADRTLLSNESEMEIVYIYRNENPEYWDSMFGEALAWRLAKELCYKITASLSLVEHCTREYEKQLALARSTDGTEGVLRALVADDWTRARRRRPYPYS